MSSEEIIRFQARHHECIATEGFRTDEEYVLYLMHLRAYEEAAKLLTSDKNVLDLGCNTGYGSQLLSRFAGEVVGADVSTSAVKEAKRRFGSTDNLSFVLTDGQVLPWEQGNFDVVVSMQVIEHVPDLRPYLSEICKVLRPGGSAVFSTPNRNARLDVGMKPWNRFHVREFMAEELREVLSEHFEEVLVLGLWATPEIARIERERVARARRAARREQLGSSLVRRAERRVTAVLRRVLRPINAIPARGRQSTLVATYSTKDLWYAQADVDESLDLLAVCRA